MRSDNEILEELKERVNAILYPETIGVEVDENIAILSGYVPSLAKRNEVAMAAAYVPGIEGIDNRMIIGVPEHIL
jgi:osmotically-inducible protein OsmY